MNMVLLEKLSAIGFERLQRRLHSIGNVHEGGVSVADVEKSRLRCLL
jgi:hypothetical protein